MTVRNLFAAIPLLAILLSGTAAAQSGASGLYGELRGGATFLSDSDLEGAGTVGEVAFDTGGLVEGAVGYEHTNFRGSTKSSNEAVLVPRMFLETRLWGDSSLLEDFVLYPSLTDTGEYRFHSETKFTDPITDKMSWSASFIDDYDSDPAGGTKSNDYRLITAIDYAF